MRTPTIYEIKRATETSAPFFFARKTLEFFGQTMKSFSVWQDEGRIFLAAPKYSGSKQMGYTRREFKNGKLISYNP